MQAMFDAGCFWGFENNFRKLNLVDVAVGYSRGHKAEPSFEQVYQANTEHVEVVLIDFEENLMSSDESPPLSLPPQQFRGPKNIINNILKKQHSILSLII